MSTPTPAPTMLCPRCKGALTPIAAGQLRCAADGSTYDLLFSRHGQLAPAAPPVTATAAPPLIPPAAPAMPQQPVPPRPLPQPPGVGPAPVPPGGYPLPPPPAAAPVVAAAAAVAAQPIPLSDGSRCEQHPAVAAICRCSKCAAPTCGTCAFWLPSELVLCPACVVAGQDHSGLSKRDRISVYWSLGLAGVATMLPILGILAAIGTGGGQEAAAIAGAAVVIFGLFPSLIGLGLGAGAIKWGKKNPPLSWASLIWNALIVAPILLLLLIGTIVG